MTMDFDVVILGYGPVGHVMAALLGQAGWRVGVFERQLGLYPLPRIGHLDHEVMRIVQAVGVASEFERDACVCKTYDWVNAAGQVLIHFDWSKPEITGWSPHYLFYQPDLDRLLAASVERHPNVQVFRGWECKSITQDGDRVTLDCQARDGGARTCTARYLIGADGANSYTRRTTGIPWTDLGFHADWLVVDYRPHDPDAAINMPEAGQICDPARPTSLFRRIGHKHCRWEFMLLPGETREDMERPERIWKLLSPWVQPGDGVLVRQAVYTFRSGLAETWRDRRVLLIGDAAHLMPPFLGQGMGSGFRDALNLAWKLGLVLQGRAPDALLDTYTEERKPHVAAIIEQAVELGKVVCVSDHAQALARDAALLSGDVPPPPPFPTLSGRLFAAPAGAGSVIGTVGPQGRVRHGAREGLFDDVVGRGWSVLTFDGNQAQRVSMHHQDLVDRLGLTITLLTDPQAGEGVVDLDGTYRGFFGLHGITALVVRPDAYVHGSAAALDEVDHLLGSLAVATRDHTRSGARSSAFPALEW